MMKIDHGALSTELKIALDPKEVESPALARLIAEVQNCDPHPEIATAYNRTYHRHNR